MKFKYISFLAAFCSSAAHAQQLAPAPATLSNQPAKLSDVNAAIASFQATNPANWATVGLLATNAAPGCTLVSTTAACRTPAAEQADKLDVDQFGAIGDGNSHPITGSYAPAYIAQFCPQATTAGVSNPEQDACSFQAALNYTATHNGLNAWGDAGGGVIHFTGHGHPYIFCASGATNCFTPSIHNTSVKIDADGPNPVEIQTANFQGFLSFGAGDIAAGGNAGSLDVNNISFCTWSAGGVALYEESAALHYSGKLDNFKATGCGPAGNGNGPAIGFYGFGLHNFYQNLAYMRSSINFQSGFWQAASNTSNTITFSPATVNGVTMPGIPAGIVNGESIDDFTPGLPNSVPSPCFVQSVSGQTVTTTCSGMAVNSLVGHDIGIGSHGFLFETPNTSFGLYFDRPDVNNFTGSCYDFIAKNARGIQTIFADHTGCGGTYDNAEFMGLGSNILEVTWQGEQQIEGDGIFGYNLSHLITYNNLFYLGSGQNSPEPTAPSSAWFCNLTGAGQWNSCGTNDQIVGVYGRTADFGGFIRDEGLNSSYPGGSCGDGSVSRVNVCIESIGQAANAILGPMRMNVGLARATSATLASTSTYLSFDTLTYNAAKSVSMMDTVVDKDLPGALVGCKVNYVSGTDPGPYQVYFLPGCSMPDGVPPLGTNMVFIGSAVTSTQPQVKVWGSTTVSTSGNINIQLEPWQIPGNAANPFAEPGDIVYDLNNQQALPYPTTLVSLNYTTGLMVVNVPSASGLTVTGGGKYTGDTLLITNLSIPQISSIPIVSSTMPEITQQVSGDVQMTDNCDNVYLSFIGSGHAYPAPNACPGQRIAAKDDSQLGSTLTEVFMGLSEKTQATTQLTSNGEAITFRARTNGVYSITSTANQPATVVQQNPTSSLTSCSGTKAISYPALPLFVSTVKIPISGACTLTITNPDSTVTGKTLNVIIVQGSPGYAVTLPTSKDGVVTAVNSTANTNTALKFYTPGDGNNYISLQ